MNVGIQCLKSNCSVVMIREIRYRRTLLFIVYRPYSIESCGRVTNTIVTFRRARAGHARRRTDAPVKRTKTRGPDSPLPRACQSPGNVIVDTRVVDQPIDLLTAYCIIYEIEQTCFHYGRTTTCTTRRVTRTILPFKQHARRKNGSVVKRRRLEYMYVSV